MPNHLNPAMLHGFCPFVSFNKTHCGGCEKKGVRTYCTAARVLVVVIKNTPKTPALPDGLLWSCEVVLKSSPKKPCAAAEALVVVRGRA